MAQSFRQSIITFLDSKKVSPIVAAVAAGLYPLIYLYSNNFSLLNSWEQFLFFLLLYLIIPIIIFYSISRLMSKLTLGSDYHTYILPILNLCFFIFFIMLGSYGFNSRRNFLVIIVAFVLGVLLRKYINKVIVFQFLIAAFVSFTLVPDFYRYFTSSSLWMQQPDAISEVVFTKRPNVYVIQPDGYANFSELKKGNYNYDNTEFESFLLKNDFKLYQNFRSNYFSTLSSNSAMFGMKHHYFGNTKTKINELYGARDIIVGENPVVSIFNNNNYKTSLLLETPYLLLNRPSIGYDYSNFKTNEISFFDRGNQQSKDVNTDLKNAIEANKTHNNFYFIEKYSPGHISNLKINSKGKVEERLNYLEKLEEANSWLTQIIKIIQQNDSDALIVIVADHGGFVGMDYTGQVKEKQSKSEIVESIFTTALAIKWPGNEPEFVYKLKSNVNLFRIIFSYLSDNQDYLNNLEEDNSYTIIEKGAPFGVYKIIDTDGKIVFEALDEEQKMN